MYIRYSNYIGISYNSTLRSQWLDSNNRQAVNKVYLLGNSSSLSCTESTYV